MTLWHLSWPKGSIINKISYQQKNKGYKKKKKKMEVAFFFGPSHSDTILGNYWSQKSYSGFIPAAQFTVGLGFLMVNQVIWKA